MQLDLAPRRRHTQSANQVQALIVFETRTNPGSLPARCPSPLERRNQRKPAFIGENERCAQLTPLFLSAARHSVSIGQWLPHHAPNCAVGVFGNSSRDIATRTTRCSNGSERERGPKSDARSDPTSSNLPHSHTQKPHASRQIPSAAVGSQIIGWDAPAHVHATCVCDVVTPDATGTHSVVSRRPDWQSGWDPVPVAISRERADGVVPSVRMFRMVSCANYRARWTDMNINF